jgi:hypothetical protein
MAPRIGSTLVSTVDDTAVVIVRWSAGDAMLTCGGVPMVEKSQYDGTTRDTTDAASAPGTLLGKRYVAGDAAEVLCVKSGAGSLALDGAPLTTKTAKPLPASD